MQRAPASYAAVAPAEDAPHDKLHFFRRHVPSFDWCVLYRLEWLAADLSCGVTLGFVLVAQSLAHAALCGVAAIRGPYSCVLAPVLYALLGTCHEASVGTGGLVSLLTGERLRALYPGPEREAERSARVALLSLLVGLILALMGALQLHFLVRFLSRPALSGFISGSALLIVKSMLGPMLSRTGASAEDALAAGDVDRTTVIVASAAFVWLYSAKTLKKRFNKLAGVGGAVARALVQFKELVALGAGTSLAFSGAANLAVVGAVPTGLPKLSTPPLDYGDAVEMLPGACLIAVVVFVSSFASAKKCALEGGYHVVASRELWALGAANVASSLVGGVPVQVGLSRSGLALSLGVKSLFGANVVVAAVVAAVVSVAAEAVAFAPRCILSAIICNAALHLLEFDFARTLWARRDIGEKQDLAVWVAAFLGTLVFGAFAGVVLAVAMSLLLVLYSVTTPNVSVLDRRASDGQWTSSPALPGLRHVSRQTTLVVRVEGPLWYANCERFHDQLNSLELASARQGDETLAIVLQASSVSFVDATALGTLEEMLRSWQLRSVHFYVASAYGQPKALLERILGEAHPALRDCSRGVDDCLERERAARAATPRKSLSVHNFSSAIFETIPEDDAAPRRAGLKLGFVRSLPSFHNFQAQQLGRGSSLEADDQVGLSLA